MEINPEKMFFISITAENALLFNFNVSAVSEAVALEKLDAALCDAISQVQKKRIPD